MDKQVGFNISMSSTASAPITDREIHMIENFKFYKKVIIITIIDFILTEIILIYECNILISLKENSEDKKPNILLFIIFTFLSFAFFTGIIVILYLKKIFLHKITRFVYLIVGIIFFCYEIVSSILNFADIDFDLDIYNIIFFLFIAISIIPKICGFMIIKVSERSIVKIDKSKVAEEQQLFLEKIVSKVDRTTSHNSNGDEIEEEEIIFTMNNKKISDKKKDKKKKMKKRKNIIAEEEEEIEEDEIADMK